MRAFFLGLFCVAVFGLMTSAKGGSMAASQSSREVEDLGEIEALDGEEGAGKPKFRSNVTVRSEFSTNAKLTGNHSSGDLIFFPQIEIGFNIPLRHNFSFDIAAKVESGIYTQEQDRGFIGYSIISTLDWRPKLNWPRIYVGAEPYHYTSFDTGERLTEALGLTAGTDWGYAFNQGYSLAFVGYSFTHYAADPSIDDRSVNRVIAGVSHQFNQRLFATLFYQFAYSDFTAISREDYRHLVGGNLTYQFTEKLFGSVASSFADNDSSQAFGSYQSFNLSVGLTMQF